MSKFKTLGKNTIYIFIGYSGSKLISFIMLPFYTHYLSTEDYGSADIISMYAMLLVNLITFSIANAIFVFPTNQSFEKQKGYFSSATIFSLINFIIYGIISIIILFLSQVYAIHNSFTDNIGLIYLLFVSNFIQQFIQQFTKGLNKIKIYSRTGIICTLSIAIFSFFLVPKYNMIGYIGAMVIANIIASLYPFYMVKAYKYISIKSWNKDLLHEMLRYSIPLIPNSLMWLIISAINRPIMETYLGLSAVGTYAVANKFPNILSSLFTSFTNSWQVSVLEEYGKKDYETFYNQIGLIIISTLSLGLAILTLFSQLIVKLFTASEYYHSWIYVPVIACSILFLGVNAHTGANFSVVKKSKYYFYSSIIGVIVSLIFNFLLIPYWGIMGCAITYTLSQGSIAACQIYYSKQFVKYNILSQLIILILFNYIIIFTTIKELAYWNIAFTIILFITILYFNKEIIYTLKQKYNDKFFISLFRKGYKNKK